MNELIEQVIKKKSLKLAPAKSDKVDPTTCLTFLGIKIDSINCTMRLPAEKLQRLTPTLEECGDRKVCTRRELESLVGQLNHACKVIRPDRTFLRGMNGLLTATSRPGRWNPHHNVPFLMALRSPTYTSLATLTSYSIKQIVVLEHYNVH